jgi:uncharacterized protein
MSPSDTAMYGSAARAISRPWQMEPADAAERIPYLDILRGMSLFGILAGNMRAFSAPAAVYGHIAALFPGRLDAIVQSCIFILVQGKFVALFSLLFGMGFAIQMTRAEARGVSFMPLYLRRMLALGLFALIHGLLIWWGDILLTYTLCGTTLVLFRRASQRTLLISIGCLTAVSLVLYGRMFLLPPPAPASGGLNMASVQQTIAIFSHGSVAAILKENWSQWKDALSGLLPPFGLYPLTVFLAGMFIWRTGIVTHLGAFKPLLTRVCLICLPLGILLNVLLATGFMFLTPRADGRLPLISGLLLTGIWLVFLTLSAGYASAVALLVQNETWKPRLWPFALVGRLALTNYVMQSVVCTAFFYGTGWYGHVGPAIGLVIALVIYVLQVACSAWWLARFRFGPLEWLWRALTYWQLPALRRHVIAPATLAAAAGPNI